MRFGIDIYMGPEDGVEYGRSDIYRMELCVRGSQRVSLGAEHFACTRGTLIFANPGQDLSILDKSADLLSYVIVLTQQLINELHEECKIPYIHSLFDLGATPYLRLSLEDSNRIASLFFEIDREIRDGQADNLTAIRLLISLIALNARRVYLQMKQDTSCPLSPGPLHKDDREKMFQLRKCLLSQLSIPPNLYDLSRAVGLSESKMKQLFRHTFGTSIYHYYQAARMEEAARLLRHLSVSETGYQLGFSNLSHFARLFARHHNLTPKKFKNRLMSDGDALSGGTPK